MPLLRFVRIGERYSVDEEDDGGVELEQVAMTTPEPPEEIQGEPWDWTKDGPRPASSRSDGLIDCTPFPDFGEDDGYGIN